MNARMLSRCAALCVGIGLLAGADAPAAGVPATVPVDDAGNAADSTGFGAVAYRYKIGRGEVSNAEYCDFLNAAARKDTYDLYNVEMSGEYGGIVQSGSWGSYAYSVKEGWGRKPVGFVSWYDSLRYCNWLTNGRGTNSTETGSYTFSGESGYGSSRDWSVTLPDHAALAAGKSCRWVLATENEWYKAAYYDPAKPGAPGYWKFATKSDSSPAASLGNGLPTDTGAFPPSAYGTFDQNGNMWEWNETREGGRCGVRGGSFYIRDHAGYAQSATRYVSNPPTFEFANYGFRVVQLGGAK